MARITELVGQEALYVIIGKEIGENQRTRHLQGYIEFSNRVRFSRARTLIGGSEGRAHIEKRRGSAAQAYKFIKEHFY